MTDIQAKDVFLQVKVGTTYKYVGCMQSLNIRHNVEDIEITTVDSGTDRDYVAGFSSAEGSFGAITTIDSLSKYQYEDFVSDRRLVKDYRIMITDSYGDNLQYDFKAKTKTIEFIKQTAQVCKFSVNFLVCGAITPTKSYDHALIGGDGELILNGDGDIIRTN